MTKRELIETTQFMEMPYLVYTFGLLHRESDNIRLIVTVKDDYDSAGTFITMQYNLSLEFPEKPPRLLKLFLVRIHGLEVGKHDEEIHNYVQKFIVDRLESINKSVKELLQ